MEFRRATTDDYGAIYALQNRNLYGVLNASERADGFLSAAFEIVDFKALNDNLGVVVCVDEEQIAGFLVASTIEFNKDFALSKSMLARCETAVFEDRPLTDYSSYITGPVCVESAQRGKGVFAGMYACLFKILPSSYDLAMTIVAKDNGRSLNAHKKVGFTPAEQFKFNGRNFYILVVKR
jgi:hypothetical protein